ncbi:T9SS type A sorting domain-containing protein [Plebeiibacterium sediminum]|uniref:T9SS type A sorting domain-containing protein n=1 Tax=Plebeiibacterium sediminum TaxID=2992112 RepID=A0AAE3SFZ6_9BACT|nr:T9SS type A sorting domain-containing protein [Plebeiobacterium sediminum]MCW3787801.1 T9SS type A sorting domain-containing protein [Plebeiobacterium sediminum]
MKKHLTLLVLALFCLNVYWVKAQLPLVYDSENSGADIVRDATTLPSLADCPVVQPLPDPFAWSADPLGVSPVRSTDPSDWEKHRQELLDMFQYYEIGNRPTVDMSQIDASFSGNVLTVKVTVGANTLTLTSTITIPTGATGPYPILIGMNSQTGSLPASNFSSRGIATMNFAHDQVVTYAGWGGSYTNNDPFFKLYPEQNIDNTGEYAAWSWGISRLIDGLYKLNGVVGSNTIDLDHIAVTGCSYAGKMALFAGAFDERIALTIAQESGGGGATSWRYSATQSDVEGLGNTNYDWFKNSMRDFAGQNISKIPTDHHLLTGLVAPRALMVTGNADFGWLSNKSCYVNSKATKLIYDELGISDRFAYVIDGGHGHCSFPTSQNTQLNYMLDKFMKGNDQLSETYEVFPSTYSSINYERWMNWWGTGDSTFPEDPNAVGIWMEAECATVGSLWNIRSEEGASSGQYVEYDIDNYDPPLYGEPQLLDFDFNIEEANTYRIFGRVHCPTYNDDSFYKTIDNGNFSYVNGLANSDWGWTLFEMADLTVGAHTFTIAPRENGAKLDKILITTGIYAPEDIGVIGSNCVPTAIGDIEKLDGVIISPNPVRDFLTVSLEDPADKVTIYDMNGQMIYNLTSMESEVFVDTSSWCSGIYFLAVNGQKNKVVKKIVKR